MAGEADEKKGSWRLHVPRTQCFLAGRRHGKTTAAKAIASFEDAMRNRTEAVELADCIRACVFFPGFMEEWDRLHGSTFARPGIDQEIDKATGKFDSDLEALIKFVKEYVYEPTRAKCGR